MSKVWFITGSSRGFGREFATSALDRGDRVIATARDPRSLDDLRDRYADAVRPLALDVNRRDAVIGAVATAYDMFGRLDVVVNNAGYGLFGAVEEVSEEEARAQFDTNVFGALWVTQAVLPYLRKQGSGHIVQVSSVGGIVAFPNQGLYHATKWALEGLSESLAQEVAAFGIKVTLVEPGAYKTDWAGASSVQATPLPAYDELHEFAIERRKHNEPGNPAGVGPALLKVVDAEAPPLRVLFGARPVRLVKDAYPARLQVWAGWEDVSIAAAGVES